MRTVPLFILLAIAVLAQPCLAVTAPPAACSGNYSLSCQENNVVSTDTSCNVSQTIMLCQPNEICDAGGSSAQCRQRLHCEGLVNATECEDRCPNLASDHRDCGTCGNQCARDAACVRGVCVQKSGCLVACDENSDCGEGEICVMPGDCAESHCRHLDLVTENESAIREAAAVLASNGYLLIDKEHDGQVLTFRLTSLAPTPIADVGFTATIPESLGVEISQLSVWGGDATRLADNQVRFTVKKIGATADLKMLANSKQDRLALDSITIKDITYVPLAEEEFVKAWKGTKEDVHVVFASRKSGNGTTFTLLLNPERGFTGLRVPIIIPQCMRRETFLAKDATNIGNTLLVWDFDTLDKATSIAFTAGADIPESCISELSAAPYAQRIGFTRTMLILIIAGIVAAALVAFLILNRGQERIRLSKEEFTEVAKQETNDAEEIERRWRDYQRRFK